MFLPDVMAKGIGAEDMNQDSRRMMMSISEIENGLRKTIDQFFKLYNQPYYQGSEEERLHFIGGVLQSALHLMPLDNYYALKDYIYKTYGYDPGGAADQQMTLEEWENIT